MIANHQHVSGIQHVPLCLGAVHSNVLTTRYDELEKSLISLDGRMVRSNRRLAGCGEMNRGVRRRADCDAIGCDELTGSTMKPEKVVDNDRFLVIDTVCCAFRRSWLHGSGRPRVINDYRNVGYAQGDELSKDGSWRPPHKDKGGPGLPGTAPAFTCTCTTQSSVDLPGDQTI